MFWSHSTTSGISWKQDNISHNKTSKTAHNNTCSYTNFSTALRQSGCNKVMKKTPATVRITLSSDTLCFPLTKGDRFHVLRNETLLPVNLYYASKMCILFNLNCHDFYVFKVTLYLYYWYLHWKLILVSVMVLLVTINLEHQDPFYVLDMQNMRNQLMWSNDRLLWTRWWTLQFHKSRKFVDKMAMKTIHGVEWLFSLKEV